MSAVRRLKNAFRIVLRFFSEYRYFSELGGGMPGRMPRRERIYNAYCGARHNRQYDSEGNVFWLPF
jgi:hypothetical protein